MLDAKKRLDLQQYRRNRRVNFFTGCGRHARMIEAATNQCHQ
jgi:hypothetical protein